MKTEDRQDDRGGRHDPNSRQIGRALIANRRRREADADRSEIGVTQESNFRETGRQEGVKI